MFGCKVTDFLLGAPLFLVVKLSVSEGRVVSSDKKTVSGSQLSKSREVVP
jgi:hypothetical protein